MPRSTALSLLTLALSLDLTNAGWNIDWYGSTDCTGRPLASASGDGARNCTSIIALGTRSFRCIGTAISTERYVGISGYDKEDSACLGNAVTYCEDDECDTPSPVADVGNHLRSPENPSITRSPNKSNKHTSTPLKMTPPPSYRSTMLSSYTTSPPSYNTLYPPESTLPTYSASTDFVEGPAIPRRQPLRWIRLLAAVSALVFYISALVLVATRFDAWITYAQSNSGFVTDVSDMLIFGLATLTGFVALLCFGIRCSLHKIYAMMTEPDRKLGNCDMQFGVPDRILHDLSLKPPATPCIISSSDERSAHEIMTSGPPLKLEQQLSVVSTDSTDVFRGRYEAWGHVGVSHLMGSPIMGQAALAAYETVPSNFSLHSVHARFLGAGVRGIPLEYEVQRITSTKRSACRIVQAKQKGVVKVMHTFNFTAPAPEDSRPQLFDYIPTPSKDTLQAASTPHDPEQDDGHQSLYGVMRAKPEGWPENTAYPAYSNTRLSVSDDKEISQRKYRIKFRTLFPNTTPKAQLVATLFFSDFYTLDTPLTVQDIDWGFRPIGGKSTDLNPSKMRVLSTLSHTLHFCATEGFDVHEGILMECVTKWAKGRRAAVGITIWDTKGKLLATGEQEGYFVFNETPKGSSSKI
ncbi:hypothetical protein PRZ48_010049 [Zasmidium cellare]|uniref:Uncharacterized protein n=1 Tax=Zasmidium cellare TaxID=395010 RepID=A0ABR0EEA3_ZASCE|nr:hypothetical protein PRZ48_010049 [Zasmidium cellare]